MSSIISGFIHCFLHEHDVERLNRQVIEDLPNSGKLIVRPMFNLIPNAHGHCYYGHLISFAAYYKECWCFDDDWLLQYENLLERLIWDSSEVVHSYSGERRTWASDKPLIETERCPSLVASRCVYTSLHDLPLVQE